MGIASDRKSHTAAIVVTYNRKQLLAQCVSCILSQKEAACDIIIVDNASTDGTRELCRDLAKAHGFIHYHNTGENIGGAGGFQRGIILAVEAGYEYVWLMDDDTLPTDTALATLFKASDRLDGNYGFLSGAALWTDNTECRMNRQKRAKPSPRQKSLAAEGIVPIAQATFVSLLLPIRSVREFGLPIKEFFIWGDDIEYTRRIAVRKKVPCYLVSNSLVIHATTNNYGSSISKDDMERIDRYHYAYRNENYLFRKEKLKGVIYYYTKCLYHLASVLVKAKDHRLKRCSIIIKQMFKGLRFNPEIEFLCDKVDPIEK